MAEWHHASAPRKGAQRATPNFNQISSHLSEVIGNGTANTHLANQHFFLPAKWRKVTYREKWETLHLGTLVSHSKMLGVSEEPPLCACESFHQHNNNTLHVSICAPWTITHCMGSSVDRARTHRCVHLEEEVDNRPMDHVKSYQQSNKAGPQFATSGRFHSGGILWEAEGQFSISRHDIARSSFPAALFPA